MKELSEVKYGKYNTSSKKEASSSNKQLHSYKSADKAK